MKKLIVLVFISLSLSLTGTTYYLSPGGSDSNPGTISKPFFTLSKAWTVVSAGDIVYLRGGTYSYTAVQILNGKSGKAGNLIKVWNYPGETPVITRAATFNYDGGYYATGIDFSGNWVHFKGLKITGFYQVEYSSIYMGMAFRNSNNCIFEQLEISYSGSGLQIGSNSTDNLVLNSDFHHNYSPLALYEAPYGDADGIGVNASVGNTNTLRGCRIWNNSDDGVDALGDYGVLVIDSCWAWNQGYKEDGVTPGGNGIGFKLGGYDNLSEELLRIIHNSISYKNRYWGFSENASHFIVEYFNNTSYSNGEPSRGGGFHADHSNAPNIIKNNISYRDNYTTEGLGNLTNVDHNSWDVGAVSNADFVSLDAAQLLLPRKADGSLPDITFLHLAPGSKLIDKGTNIGVTYKGNAPDLGPFESGLIEPPVPVYVSSAIQNAAPAVLELTYNLSLANITPAASAFKVRVNSVIRTVSSVTVSGTIVILTLASGVVYGDVVTVAYTKPAVNPLKTTSGGSAVSITAKSVTNNCLEIVKSNDPPILVIKNETSSYSGFVGDIDASGSYDLDNDILTYEWIVPVNVSVSSTSSSKIQFLSPVVNTDQIFVFQLKVNDGKVIVSKSISINIMPYKPELTAAKIINIEASLYNIPDYPDNIADGNATTKWSVNGDNQWLVIKLAKPFEISHLEIAFLPGQKYESYFEIFASKDNLTWESILSKTASCNFSGSIQVFDFPSAKSGTEYSYIKLVGHGNSLNTLNSFSEFKTFGILGQITGSENIKAGKIKVYPNPAHDIVNISIEDPDLTPQIIKIIDLSGKIVYTDPIEQGIKNIQIPENLKTGVYIVTLQSDNLILYAQKLVINK